MNYMTQCCGVGFPIMEGETKAQKDEITCSCSCESSSQGFSQAA